MNIITASEKNTFNNSITRANMFADISTYKVRTYIYNLKYTGSNFFYHPDIVSINDYYPFGMAMGGRSFSTNQYRYGFNGQEKETEITGSESHYSAEFWMYDSRLGRRWNIDPVVKEWESSYTCFGNNPIIYNDENGDDYVIKTKKNDKGKTTHIKLSATVYIKGAGASEERAKELTKFAKGVYKTKTVDGIEVSFDIKYKFDPSKQATDLKKSKGENLLDFDSKKEDYYGGVYSKVNGYKRKGREYTGNTGVIINSGKSNTAITHETMHFIGFTDRYLKNYPKPDPGYENDIMGVRGKTKLHINHYKNIVSYVKTIKNSQFFYSNHMLDQKKKNGKWILKP